ncbi:MAG TPA: family 20 glycosylhydrolase [Pseudomonadales bacterium]
MTTTTKLPPLMPMPRTVRLLDGAALPERPALAPEFARVRTPRLERAAQRLLDRLPEPASAHALPLVIDCDAAAPPHPDLEEDESYALSVTAEGIRLTGSEWGVLRGLATLAQLFGGAGPVPPLNIEDAPRLPWRGLMLDVARHFIPLRDLLRTLDAMELVKLDVLHLHLSDDQGFRFPSRRYPRLPSAEHYALEELQRLVAAAADRGIRVVPELDVPGHVTSWLIAHPEWGNRPAQPSRRFGVHRECLDPTRGEVLTAVKTLFGELAEVFPDRCLHMGGDEVHPEWWSQDERIRAYMEREGLRDVAALQARFQREVALAIERLGRRAMGWDEVLHADLPRGSVIQAWRGVTARDRALAAGHDCVLSAPYYLDLFYPAGQHYGFDPAAPQPELVAREDALARDPRLAHVAAGLAWTRQWREGRVDRLPEGGCGRLLGAEACLWAELVDARLLDLRLWGRLPALAERFWSPADVRDEHDLYRRLETIVARLPEWAGVDPVGDSVRLMRAAGLPPEWQPLADALEPVKWYGRLLGEQALRARLDGREMPLARPYDADSPLDRVVDALPPESAAARRLSGICDAELAGDPDARSALAAIAHTWAELPAVPAPAELEPLAARLRGLGRSIEQVLGGTAAPGTLRAAAAAAAEPVGEYLLAAALVLADWSERREAAAG